MSVASWKDGWTIVNLPENENEIWDKKLELKIFVSTSGDVYRYTA
jgi:hypothetical protein